MAKAMVKLAKLSPSDRFILGGRARQRAVDRFDMRVIAGEYARLYTKIATMSKGGQ
jgi:glycosyltransferase involved in cell wall biosynthesis